jgi:DNA-binding IscR family transcriptional regulator
MLENAPCSDERSCPAHQFWKTHREAQVEFLRRTTIAAMAEFTRRQLTGE